MSGHDVTTSFAVALVDELARNGLRHAVLSPGSRNTPLALALARDDRVLLDVVIDERSAGFRALGIGMASGGPALVCCTSGTAAVNLHPAVVEAHHACVPLLVATADRPPELRDWGAGQTIDQHALYGDAVRWFHDPGPPRDAPGAPAQWRALACRAFAAASGGPAAPAGPVHMNLPFREPLVPTGEPMLDAPGRPGGAPWARTTRARARLAPDDTARLAEVVRAHPRGLVVAGPGAGASADVVDRFATAARWPVFADPLSQLRRGSSAVSCYEAIVRAAGFADAHRPAFVLRLGAPITSKAANAWLEGVPQVVVDPGGRRLDPTRDAAEQVIADPDQALDAIAGTLGDDAGDDVWWEAWLGAESRVRSAIDAVLDASEPCEAQVARDLAAAVPDGTNLVVASSLPVRALEWAMAPRDGIRVFANRGANGIDGFVSTAAGVATAASGPTVALCGDLCFLHDTNGLMNLPRGVDLTYVVIDNDGGGIFSYLPQAPLPEFEQLFGTPHGLDLVEVARAHGVDAVRADRPLGTAAGPVAGARVVVVPVDRAAGVSRHRALWDAAVTALAGDTRVASGSHFSSPQASSPPPSS